MRKFLYATLSSLTILTALAMGATEAMEITAENISALPKGKEADGILGDFVMRNEFVEVLIAKNAPDRRANMSTYYGTDGMTPGCLYDLGLKDAANDQLVIFSPCGQRGLVSWVRIVKAGEDGEAVVETVTTAAAGKGLFRQHTYRLKSGWQGVEVTTTLRNESAKPIQFTTDDKWGAFSKTGDAAKIRWGDAIDIDDKNGYAVDNINGELELKPGEQSTLTRFLAVGRSPAEAVGLVLQRRGEANQAEILVHDEVGKPVATARIGVLIQNREVPAYPGADGRILLRLPVGEYKLKASDRGRSPVAGQLIVEPGKPAQAKIVLGAQSAVEFDIKDEAGDSTPCKAMFTWLDAPAKESLDLGPNNRAHGCIDQWHSETGKFRVALPAGKYRVAVTRGIEFSSLRQEIEIKSGETVKVAGVLKRLVDTTGWISADFHNHSTPSGDNTCGTDDRIINLVAEHIEFAPTTEHNRFYDWTPHIEKLGLKRYISTVVGMELTGAGQHLNAFPFTVEPGLQDSGAPKWVLDTRINAINLRHWQNGDPDRYVQVNHPNFERVFVDRDADGIADDGFIGIGQYIDCWEVQNTDDPGLFHTTPVSIVADQQNPLNRRVVYNREFLWLQLLNQGHRLKAIAAADAHTVYGNGVGGWRNFYPSKTDDPAKVDWREISQNARAGRALLTTGPFLEVTLDGKTVAGIDHAAPGGEVKVHLKVQCNDWVEIDKVYVLVNGREVQDYVWTREKNAADFTANTVRFEKDLTLKLKEDAHLIFVACGMNADLKGGYGTSAQSKLRPIAYLNPMYVDVDGGGWNPNKDTLGYPIPTGGLTIEKATKLLGQ